MKCLPCITAKLLLEHEFPLMIYGTHAGSSRFNLLGHYHKEIQKYKPNFPINYGDIIRELERMGILHEFYSQIRILNAIYKIEKP